MRTGIGYDIHPLVSGRPLVLGGIRIDHDLGLSGYSDGDVLVHAVIDALLGAAALGDIGMHFPPADPRYAGANSLDLLKEVVATGRDKGHVLVNMDATVIAEAPRLAPNVPSMRQSLANALGIAVDNVSVKAKTSDGLGTIGRSEAIAALAIVLLD
jgi:2-C-methyl-D-erythritol 2,4-cyclodiphosphate synthase